jgi:hypothetical protein
LIRIFPCDYAYTYHFVVFKKVKSVLKGKTKKNKRRPNAMWHSGRDLPPCRSAAGTWRRPARHGSDGRNLPPWGMAPDVYFSKFLIQPFIF